MSEPPSPPLLIFDGDCSFCRVWIDLWKQLTGDQIAYAPYQEVAAQFPQIPLDHFKGAVQLVLPGGDVLSGAHAVFCSLAVIRKYAWMLWAYQRIPGFARISEWIYGLVAAHRSFSYHVTVLFWGRRLEPASYEIVTRWFLRCLGVVYLIAFLSLEVQITGLVGSRGMLPAARFLTAVQSGYGAVPWLRVPTIFWLGVSDVSLRLACVSGAIASIFILIGVVRRAGLVAAFILYLSLVTIGQAFLSFQWDFLLLEAGFLAIFLLPTFPRIWLFRWLLFRLMFLSGTAKLLSHDPAWRNLTALEFHFQTQPLPTVLAWYFHQVPAGFQKASVVFMFFVELVVPFLMFAPRRIRLFAGAMTLALQALIFLTGNYAFFNLLTAALCLPLCDDALLRRFARTKPARPRTRFPLLQRAVTAVLLCFILPASGFELMETFSGSMPRPAAVVLNSIAPFGIVNTYGLFAVMTTSRPEIIVEGSNDGQTWFEYGFKYKPGDLKRAPVWVEPHQPRLDWQMWFAALSGYQSHPWFVNFMVRLLEGSPDVLALLAVNPFPASPPQYIRARLYDYRFTTVAERRATGNWWRREPQGEYFPLVSLKRR